MKRRPDIDWSLAITIVTWLLAALPGLLRAVQAGLDWDLLQSLPSQPGPLYLLLSGALSGLAAGFAALVLMLRWRRALHACGVIAALLTAYYWMDRLVVAGGPDRSAGLPFAVAVNILLLAWVCLTILGLRGAWQASFAPSKNEVKQ